MMLFLFLAFLTASFSYVWIFILLDPDMVFGWLYSVAYRKLGDDGLKGKLFKVLFSCSYCNTGQLALWSYLYLYREYDYSFYYHIMFISFSILIAHVLIKLLNKS